MISLALAFIIGAQAHSPTKPSSLTAVFKQLRLVLEDKAGLEEGTDDHKMKVSETVDKISEDGMTLTNMVTIKSSAYVESVYSLSFNWTNLKSLAVRKSAIETGPPNDESKTPVVALTIELRTPIKMTVKNKTVGELAGTSTDEKSKTVKGFEVIFRKREDAERAQSLLLSIAKQKKLKVASS